MKILTQIALLFLLVCSLSVGAQTQPPPASIQSGKPIQIRQALLLKDALTSPQKFSSNEGRFTISLPPDVDGFAALTPKNLGFNGSGGNFQWQAREAIVVVQYIHYKEKPPQSAQDYVNFFAGLIDGTLRSLQSKPLAEKRIKYGDYEAIKFEFQLPNGVKATQRTIIADKMLYNLIAFLSPNASDAEPLVNKVFDTFALIKQTDVDAELRRKVEAATPKPLPQTPVAAKLKSDAEDENLKGKVKMIVTENEDLSGTWSTQGRHIESIEHFNENGNLVKSEMYYNGLPSDIAVFGYLNGARVSDTNSIERESSTPGIVIAAAPAGKSQTKRDLRYTYKYAYKYDAQGRLAEIRMIHNDGELWQRRVYSYKGNQKTELVYDEKGDLNQKYVSILDSNGNEIEEINYDIGSEKYYGDRKYSYVYEFDAQGNWIKKTTSKLTMVNGKTTSAPHYVTYRTINYN
jgi:YD repeat-containing protein